MFEFLKTLYLNGKLADSQLDKAIEKNWITEDQKHDIFIAWLLNNNAN